jgi:hypothetical protein
MNTQQLVEQIVKQLVDEGHGYPYILGRVSAMLAATAALSPEHSKDYLLRQIDHSKVVANG